MNTIKNFVFFRSPAAVAAVFCGFLFAVIYWFLRAPTPDITHNTRSEESAIAQSSVTLPSTAQAKPSAAVVNQRAADGGPVFGAVPNTFLPGVRHNVRVYTGPLTDKGLVPNTVPNWWLYAYSQEEAAWLDKHGYPTPSEAERLSNSTNQELIQAYKAGDLNAMAHLDARIAMDAITTDTAMRNEPYAHFSVDSLTLLRLSPYQALVLTRGYMDAKEAYYRQPLYERTESQRQDLQVRAGDIEFASVLLQALGEAGYLAITAADNWTTGMNAPGRYSSQQLPAQSFADSLFKVQQARIAAGLTPLDFQKRPTPLDTTQRRPAPTQALERY